MRWYVLWLAVVGYILQPVVSQAGDQDLRVIQAVQQRGDTLYYPVGVFRHRLRLDVVHFTCRWYGDSLATKVIWSQLMTLMAVRAMPDTANLQVTIQIERFERRHDGRVTKGPVWINHPNLKRLLQADERWRFSQPPPAVTTTMPLAPKASDP